MKTLYQVGEYSCLPFIPAVWESEGKGAEPGVVGVVLNMSFSSSMSTRLEGHRDINL